MVNPTLGLEVDQVYTFVQKDRSNYFHPLGITQTNSQKCYTGIDAVDTQEIYTNKFTLPSPRWAGLPTFSVQVMFSSDNDNVAKLNPEYYCILHHGMSGRIQLLQNGVPLNNSPTVSVQTTTSEKEALAYQGYQDSRSEFDQACGSFGLDPFQLPNPLCPDRFVCGTEDVSDELQHFATCLDAANCAMMS